jgi:hypothetical protein
LGAVRDAKGKSVYAGEFDGGMRGLLLTSG